MKTPLLITATIATALALTGCITPSAGNAGYQRPTANAPDACQNCGTVTHIQEVTTTHGNNAPSATGAILGGVVGAIAGHQISGATGGSKGNQNISALAGAAAGVAGGNAIQKRGNADSYSYDIQVQMDDGRVIVVNQKNIQGININSLVRLTNNKLIPR